MTSDKQNITPHLWFDKEAKQAAEFYCSIFPNSKITSSVVLHDTPSDDTEIISFELDRQPFMAMSAGPQFKINPSISFILNFDPSRDPNAQEEMDRVWEEFSKGGKPLMPLQEYDFSKRYGWIEDKYGLSWQLILSNPEGEERPFITPALMFVGDNTGRAEEAVNFYLSVFKNARMGSMHHYPKEMEFVKEGNVQFADFMLEKTWFAVMDSAYEQPFDFNEAISFIVYCKDQKEIDYYWEKLSAVPEAEQCGWLKDQFGVSWQIVPPALDEMLINGSREQIDRVTQAFLSMKKLVIADLEKAYKGDG